MTQTQAQQPVQSAAHLGMNALGGRRLCGSGRTANSIYLECGMYLHGTPIEQHLLDPVKAIDPVQFGLSAQGVKVIDIAGVKHVIDHVGSNSYPRVSDFIEEGRLKGLSRKIPITADMRGLSAASTILLVHSQAAMKNAAQVSAASQLVCPNGIHQPGDNCSGLHWVSENEQTTRHIENLSYELTPRRDTEPKAEYTTGIFMAAPITCITIIRPADGRIDPKVIAAAKSTGLPVKIADE